MTTAIRSNEDRVNIEKVKQVTAFLETSLQRHLGWIAAADAKTAVIFTIAMGMVALLAATAPKYGDWTAGGVTCALGAAGLLLADLICLAAAIIPRTKPVAPSLIYFGTVADRSLPSYSLEVMALTETGYVDDLIVQTHTNASIAATKYYWIKRATILLYVSVIPWIGAVYLLFRDKQ